MSSSFPDTISNFIPETHIFPSDDFPQYDVKLRQYLNRIASSVNRKDSGLYTDEEVVTGQQFIPIFDSDKTRNLTYRDVYRKVIDIGALPDSTTKSVPHGISTTENFSIVKFYGAATDPGVSTLTRAIPIPFTNTSPPSDEVRLEMDATDILVITRTNNFIDFIRCFVVVEYIQIV